MAVALEATRNALATKYGTMGMWIGVATASPGTTTTPANEATGGSPAYARKQTTWASASASTITGSAVTVDLAAGAYSHAILASAVTTGAANGVDYASIESTTLAAQGQIVISPTFTMT